MTKKVYNIHEMPDHIVQEVDEIHNELMHYFSKRGLSSSSSSVFINSLAYAFADFMGITFGNAEKLDEMKCILDTMLKKTFQTYQINVDRKRKE